MSLDMRKKVLIGLAILVGTPLLVLAALVIWIDSVARQGIETASTLALKVPTHLESASVRFAGRARLEGFTISNPERYKEATAASFERFEASVDTGSLLKDVIQVQNLRVVRPDLTVEFIGFRTNWSVLMANLASTCSRERPGEPHSGKTFHIAQLRVEGATVHFRSNLLPGGSHALHLAPFELKNIGDPSGGATMAEVLSTLFLALAGHALRGEDGGLPAQLVESFRTEATRTAEEIRDIFASGARHLQEVGNAFEQELKQLFAPRRSP
jgi:hypothetical protein